MIVQGRIGEGIDRLGDIVTTGFDRDVIVVGKVDAGVRLGWVIGDAKQLSFDFRVWRASDVLAISPLPFARAASRAAAARVATAATATVATAVRATARSAVGIRVERTRSVAGTPAIGLRGGGGSGSRSRTRLEVGCRSPVAIGLAETSQYVLQKSRSCTL
jgi:hypothetical protein